MDCKFETNLESLTILTSKKLNGLRNQQTHLRSIRELKSQDTWMPSNWRDRQADAQNHNLVEQNLPQPGPGEGPELKLTNF